MTIFRPTYTASLANGSQRIALSVLDCTISMDEGTAPYTRGTLRIARPAPTLLARLDPAVKPEVFIRVTDADGKTRSWFLNVTARQVDPETGDVSMNVETAEAFLFDYAPTADVDLRAYQNTYSQAQQVLRRALGGTPAFANAAAVVGLPTYSAKKNLIPIPSFETDWSSPGWSPSGVTLARVTTWRQVGSYSLQMTPNTSNPDSYADLPVDLSAGKTYTASGYVRFATSPSGSTASLNRARGISIVTTDQAGTRVLTTSNQGSTTAGAVTRVSVTFTVPDSATANYVRLYNGYASGSSAIFWDALMLTEGNGKDTNGAALTYFDGSTTQTGYAMAWDGQAHVSTSTRTPTVDRPEELYVWEAGVSAWDYLQPIMQAAGVRLFQTGLSPLWQLSTIGLLASTRVVRLSAGVNLYSFSDLLSRTATAADGLPLFADGILIRYTWLDAQGVEQKRTDAATVSGYQKLYVMDRDGVTYPGPGTAAYVLQRIQARRKQLNVTGAPDYDAAPSQLVAITAPDGTLATGIIHAVTHDFATGVMTLTTKGLVEVPANSVGRSPSGQTIGAVSGSLADYTN